MVQFPLLNIILYYITVYYLTFIDNKYLTIRFQIVSVPTDSVISVLVFVVVVVDVDFVSVVSAPAAKINAATKIQPPTMPCDPSVSPKNTNDINAAHKGWEA